MPIPHNKPVGPPTSNDFLSRPVTNSQSNNKLYWTKKQTVLEDGSVQLDGDAITAPRSTLHIPKTYRLIYSYPGEIEYNEDNEGSYISSDETECGCDQVCEWTLREYEQKIRFGAAIRNPELQYQNLRTGGPLSYSYTDYLDYANRDDALIAVYYYGPDGLDPPVLLYSGPTMSFPEDPPLLMMSRVYEAQAHWELICDGEVVGVYDGPRRIGVDESSVLPMRCPEDYPNFNSTPCVDPSSNPCGSP